MVGLPHITVHDERARAFGGTTTLWGDQALRFDDFELRERTWVPHSGWPISEKALEPFYERAEDVLQLGPRIPYLELCNSFEIEPPAFDPHYLYMECSRWSPKPNLGRTYREELSVEFETLAGKSGSATARFYVICCGGIETARLLLASDRVARGGVGNQNDLVGRYLQEPVYRNYGKVFTGNRGHLQDLFESFFVKGLKHAPLVTISQRMQMQKRLLSVHGIVVFETPEDSSIAATKKLFRAMIGRSFSNPAELRRFLGRSLADPGELLRLAYRLRVKKRAATPKKGPILFGAQCEMAPNPDSRVLLSDTRDCLGIPRVKLNWRLGELERRTLSEFVKTIATESERLGLGTFDLKQEKFLEDSSTSIERAHDSAHHMGTARMHESPRHGVVDSHCRVYGIANLYIGGSAVFPTSARSNATLMVLALLCANGRPAEGALCIIAGNRSDPLVTLHPRRGIRMTLHVCTSATHLLSSPAKKEVIRAVGRHGERTIFNPHPSQKVQP